MNQHGTDTLRFLQVSHCTIDILVDLIALGQFEDDGDTPVVHDGLVGEYQTFMSHMRKGFGELPTARCEAKTLHCRVTAAVHVC